MPARASLDRPSAAPPAEKDLVRRLEDALSEQELRRVFGSALLVLNPAARKRLFARLDRETTEALTAVLAPPRKHARPREPAAVPGKGKLRQEWARLWQEWAQVVRESGEEDGKYVQQDAEWESPYVVPSSITADLDAIASRMRGLIPLVVAQNIAPGFSFAKAVREMNDDLYAGLPEWLDAESGDPCYLGPQATACLIDWEWTLARRAGQDVATFLDGIRDLETRLTKVELDYKTITTFVLEQSEAQLRALLASMVRQRSSARWADAFSRAHGCWAEILRKLAKRWDPALFATTSRANIRQDWTLALPLVEDAVRRKVFAEATGLIDEALRSKLRLDGDKAWDPRKELLVQRERYYASEEQRAETARLLRRWQEAAQAQGQMDLTAALGLQIVAFDKAEDGKRMLEAFRKVPPQLHAISDALFAAWRTLVVQRTFHLWGETTLPCGDWLPALINAARAGETGAASFHSAVRASLEKAATEGEANSPPVRTQRWVPAHRQGPRECLLALAVLTRDLDATASTFSESAPKLWRLLPKAGSGERDGFAAARRRWCKLLGGQELVPEILAFWREHAVRFVPDPGATTSDYSELAKWLAAVHEINSASAGELLARWAAAHRLKRNLWRDLARQGIAIPPGVRTAR